MGLSGPKRTHKFLDDLAFNDKFALSQSSDVYTGKRRKNTSRHHLIFPYWIMSDAFAGQCMNFDSGLNFFFTYTYVMQLFDTIRIHRCWSMHRACFRHVEDLVGEYMDSLVTCIKYALLLMKFHTECHSCINWAYRTNGVVVKRHSQWATSVHMKIWLLSLLLLFFVDTCKYRPVESTNGSDSGVS